MAKTVLCIDDSKTIRLLVKKTLEPLGYRVLEAEDGQAGVEHAGQQTHQSSTWRMARNASCGTSTEPICFMRFLPAFCFSSSFFLRVMSPP